MYCKNNINKETQRSEKYTYHHTIILFHMLKLFINDCHSHRYSQLNGIILYKGTCVMYINTNYDAFFYGIE